MFHRTRLFLGAAVGNEPASLDSEVVFDNEVLSSTKTNNPEGRQNFGATLRHKAMQQPYDYSYVSQSNSPQSPARMPASPYAQGTWQAAQGAPPSFESFPAVSTVH